MYQLDDNFVKVSSYDFYLALEYIARNDIKISEKIYNRYIDQLVTQNCIKIQSDYKLFNFESSERIIQPIEVINYILEAYKSELNLQMIQNSILWSIINIENDKKCELELLYKNVIATKFKIINIWDDKKENQLILKLLKDNQELYEYIIFTQNMDEYIEDIECKEQIEQKLTKHLKQ